jgi:hypothetical protein
MTASPSVFFTEYHLQQQVLLLPALSSDISHYIMFSLIFFTHLLVLEPHYEVSVFHYLYFTYFEVFHT